MKAAEDHTNLMMWCALVDGYEMRNASYYYSECPEKRMTEEAGEASIAAGVGDGCLGGNGDWMSADCTSTTAGSKTNGREAVR